MFELVTVKNTVNLALTNLGATSIQNDVYYWSSNQANSPGSAWAILPGDTPSNNSQVEYLTNHLCAVHEF